MQEHDGEQLAALGQYISNVVNVGKSGVAEGSGEGVGEGDEEERRKDLAVRNQGRRRLALRRCRHGEELAGERGKEGLNRKQEDRELEALGRGLGPVSGGGKLFLQVSPCKAISDGIETSVRGFVFERQVEEPLTRMRRYRQRQ